MIARSKPGIALSGTRDELDALAKRLAATYPETNRAHRFEIVSLHEEIAGDTRPALRVLFAASVLLLVAVAVNLSALFIARNAEREHDLGVRKALGASTAALIRLTFVEGLLLAGSGSALGLLVASWGVDVVRTYAPRLPRVDELRLDPRAFAFAVAAALAVMALAQSHALIRIRRLAPVGARRTSSPTRSVLRLRSVLLTVQTGLATVLLVGSALLILSAVRLERVAPGFDAAHVLSAQISLPQRSDHSPLQAVDGIGRMVERIAMLPGVASAAAITDLPFSGSRTTTGFDIVGRPPAAPGEEPTADRRAVTAHYFRSMGVPVVEGRAFGPNDDARGQPVAIVNRTMARRYWPDGRVIDRRIRIGHPDEVRVFGRPVWRQIVGIVGDVHHDDLTHEPAPEIYLPLAQSPTTHVAFVVRASGDASQLTPSIRSAIAKVEPREPLYDIRTMEQRLSAFTAPARFRAGLLAAFSALGLTLAVVGAYGAVRYAVAQREREFAIRLALGASARNLVLALLRSAGAICVAGIAAGLIGAFILRSFLSTLVFEVDALHPPALGAAAALVAIATFLAWWLPARRVHDIEPAAVLRRET